MTPLLAAAGAVALALVALTQAAPARAAQAPRPDGGGEAGAAQADSPIQLERQAGATRYETAAQIATARFSAPQTDVVIATGEGYADALAGSALEGSLSAPVLLVPSTLQGGAVPTAITDAIDELSATNATLLGGEGAVSAEVEQHLVESSTVTTTDRVQGSTRFETAEEIATQVSASPVPADLEELLGLDDSGDVAFLATGVEFADALSAGAGAYQGPHPILLTGPDELHPAAERGLEAAGADTVIILGGQAAVSQQVEAAVADAGYATERLAGADRWGTAKAVADAFVDGFGFDVADVGLATGESFADALASAPYLGEVPAPVVLTPGDTAAGPTEDFFAERACDVETLHVFGGEQAVSQGVAEGYAEHGCPDGGDGGDGAGTLSSETVEGLDAEDTGQDQDFTFTVAGEPIGAGDVVTIDVSDADAGNADYAGASVDAAGGAGTAVFDPVSGVITYTGTADGDAVDSEITVTLQDVDAGAAQAGLEAQFQRGDYSNAVTFDIVG